MKKIYDILDVDLDINIYGITDDSRLVKSGYLFVATKGYNVDHYNFIDDAVKNGASFIIADRDVLVNVPYFVVEDVDINKFYIDCCKKYYDVDINCFDLIGITGTDGKTSTSTIIYQLLNQVSKCGYIGTNGVKCPTYEDKSNNTTPTTEHLNRFLNNFYLNKCTYTCMETASEGLVQGRCENIEFDYSVFTNLTHEHLNFHKTMDNYLKAKSILFKQTKKEGTSILNIDDPYAKEMSKYCSGKVLFYGKDVNADFRFTNVVITPEKTYFDLVHNNTTYNITSPLLGMFNVYNLTAALAILITDGYDINKFNLNDLYVDGRMTDINLGQNFKVIVDYAHTPNGYLNLFELTKTLKANRTIIVAGSAGERDKEKRPVMGKILVDNADLVVFTYEDPRSEDPEDIIDDLTKEVMDKQDKFIRIVDRKDAIKYAINIAEEKDMILILGKGNETYETLKNGKIYFNDIEEAKNALKEITVKL